MKKQVSGLVLLALAMILGVTVPASAQKREQDRSCTDHRSRSDDKPERSNDKPDRPKKEPNEKVELRGSVGPDGKSEGKVTVERPKKDN